MSLRKTSKILILLCIGGAILAVVKKYGVSKGYAQSRSYAMVRKAQNFKVRMPSSVSARAVRLEDAPLRVAVAEATSGQLRNGVPIVRYDSKQSKIYWEYPDGKIKYKA